MNTAILALEDGTILSGQRFGAEGEAVFELVFNTSMSGYQEILSDPSYRGQGVLFTAPHIGNTGINLEDNESQYPQISAVVVRSLSPVVSSWRARGCLPDWLAEHGIQAISGVDTRYLTRKLRDQGTQRAALSTCGTDPDRLLAMARTWPGLDGRDMVTEVTCPQPYRWSGDPGDRWVGRPAGEPGYDQSSQSTHLVVYDFGVKRNILRHLAASGAEVTVVPAGTPAERVLAMRPDGVVLSNGPGDPAGLSYAVSITRDLLAAGVPILGICLGHQLLGLALGGCTRRLKFGHHGGNHPVQDLRNGRVLITAQNHNYFVETDSLDASQVEVTHLSLNDGSLEGLRLRDRPVMSVQFHPEASPGPHDAHGLFAEFFALIRDWKQARGNPCGIS